MAIIKFKYGCFISYRRGKHELVQKFIADVTSALRAYVEPWLDDVEPVFVDDSGIEYGDDIPATLADALCHSICMVMIFTPSYFSKAHPWCTREYRAMKCLEQDRIDGLVIPIIFRGDETLLPSELRDKKCVDFSDYTLGIPKMAENANYRGELEKIAERTHKLFKQLEGAEDGCEGFVLPTIHDACKWLDENDWQEPEFKLPGRK